MSEPLENGNALVVQSRHVHFPQGFDVCWAGPSPLGRGLCYGSVDGQLLFDLAPPDQAESSFQWGNGSYSKEAINGVARGGMWVAVSTRSDVTLYPFPGTKAGQAQAAPCGAHDVIATASGYFVAPLGRSGIMTIDPSPRGGPDITVHTDNKGGLDVYKVAALRGASGVEVLACAVRADGLAVGTFAGPQNLREMRTATFRGLDVVDVCPLVGEGNTAALAALARDGSVILFRDPLGGTTPLTMKFKRVKGVGYRLVCVKDEIYVLTSKALYALGKLASRFMSGELQKGVITQILTVPMETVDLNVAEDRWLLVVTDNEVRVFDADWVHNHVPEGESDDSPLPQVPDWKWKDVEHTARDLQLV